MQCSRGRRGLLAALVLLAPLWSSSLSLSPRDVLNEWRQQRLDSTAKIIDPSRYHLNILFIDDDNSRARVAEGCLERVAEWADAGWWLYPFCSTIAGEAKTIRSPSQNTVDVSKELGLCQTRATAPGARLARSDLDSYDLVIALDDDVRDKVVSSLKQEMETPEEEIVFYQSRLRLLSDFGTILMEDVPEDPAEAAASWEVSSRKLLHPDLFERISPFLGQVRVLGALDSMRALPVPGEQALFMAPDGTVKFGEDTWRMTEAAMILCIAGLVQFSKDTIDDSFNQQFDQLLENCFNTREALDYDYDRDVEPVVRRYEFTGALSIKERKRRFEDYAEKLRSRFKDDNGK